MAGRDSPRPQDVPPEGREQHAPNLRAVGAAATSASAPEHTDKRPLHELEVRVLRGVFADGISYGPVRLVRMAPFIAQLNGSRAFVLGNTLNLPERNFDAISRGQQMDLLVHEATHIWQYQHRGWGYVAEALWAQGFGDGYDYVKALRAGKPWRKMNPEQQAQMIQDAFRGRYFDAPGARFGAVGNTGTVVLPGWEPPDGFSDFTSVLVAAVETLQKPGPQY
jgi:hypothetical protein